MTNTVSQNNKMQEYMYKLLTTMASHGGSDLFISKDFAPTMKAHGTMTALSNQKLSPETTKDLAYSIMNKKQIDEFEIEFECNFAISIPNVSRFRVNVLMQQNSVSMVIRTIASEIPNFDKMKLPSVLKDVITMKRGLVLIVGGTGSGKSTTMAAMIDHRNASGPGHIITVEDPVEYVHVNKQCLVTHREVGVDTLSWHNALKNTLRQAPDVILIGEIRDTETMEHAIAFAETGHLCLGTLHANNANQTLDRIINFFPEERRNQLLMDLSSNLKAVVSQRLIRTNDGKRKAAIEILLNNATISDAILKGNFGSIKELMKKGTNLGMQTFDQAIFTIYEEGLISYEDALRNADSENELRLEIKLRSQRAQNVTANNGISLSIQEHPTEEEK